MKVQKYTNMSGVPLPLAVFLATDNYDYQPKGISVTSLIKPIRQIVLSKRVPPEDNVLDVISLVKSRMGQAIHDAIERAWLGDYKKILMALGHPQHVVDLVVVNPDPSTVTPDQIPVYLEQRSFRELMGVLISGKFDFVAEGRVEDFKSTSVYTYIHGRKDDDYQLQGSLYRWLNPKLITSDFMAINYIFTDWMPGLAGKDNYPSAPIARQMIPLLSLDETEHFVAQKIRQIAQFKDAPEDTIPECNDQELWRKAPVYKYYRNPASTGRSTKNFDNAADAYKRLAEDGGVGKVVEVSGEVVACKYCPAFPVCTQKDRLIADGSLIL